MTDEPPIPPGARVVVPEAEQAAARKNIHIACKSSMLFEFLLVVVVVVVVAKDTRRENTVGS